MFSTHIGVRVEAAEVIILTAHRHSKLYSALPKRVTKASMFASLLRSRNGRRRVDKSPFSSPFADSPDTARQRVVGQSIHEEESDTEESPTRVRDGHGDRDAYFDQQDEDEDGDAVEEDEDAVEDEDVDTPLLPIFSAPHLDRLPLYNITHSVRILIVQKAETTLSWDQLRSPQVSQFLVKPIQSTIRSNHFNRATLCALIANCLQFQKEAQMQPGNAGVNKTRSMISELLAMRLIKEFTTRELIDALSYDFDPLAGLTPPATGHTTPGMNDWQRQRAQVRGARVSTVEIAIRAHAKRFLAHPLVVQHLEAIWAGTIVFHSAADNLHRKPSRPQVNGTAGYGTLEDHAPSVLPADNVLGRKAHDSRVNRKLVEQPTTRRSVTLYDPRDASLFKLSRLRVPRYRQLFSTLSFATMLGLFLAVLIDRSLTITPLEVVFWFWSVGYMLDEVVGFSEQGFGLYILSVWNAFDLGILLLFVTYYALRLYGIVLAEGGKHRISSMAYDVLASTAVLLFPRLFSVLDHYRYFSQLLIAFRMMAQDLIAILILILISCSGFFIAFTLSFSDDETDGNAVAYALFQILMGFTPAAWEKWSGYNMLGKAIMTMFLIICHFLIVTILITVLTNSFMAIVQNANEEHQFLFAVNTISMVKSDALFSYVAPSNVLGWICSPLRYIIPFRQFVKVNRTVIKVTHFPILFVIFSYERLILSKMAYEPMDLVERPARSKSKPLTFSINKAPDLFSPTGRLREPSVISFHKDRALEEVFRRPFRGSTMRTTAEGMDDRRDSTNVVDTWMQAADNEGGASPPMEQPRSVLERLEHRARPSFRRSATADRLRTFKRDFSTNSRSVISDPDLTSIAPSRRPQRIEEETEYPDMSMETLPQETDADEGDDELGGNEESDATPGVGESATDILEIDTSNVANTSDDENFHTPTTAKTQTPIPAPSIPIAARARLLDSPDILTSGSTSHQARPHDQRAVHMRSVSDATIMFAPQQNDDASSDPRKTSRPTTARHNGSGGTGTPSPGTLVGRRTPKNLPAKARPILPPRHMTRTTPNLAGMSFLDAARRSERQRNPSFNARALDLASEIGDGRYVSSPGMDAGGISGMPASFNEQLLRDREIQHLRDEQRRRSEEEEKGMVNRIMLARMNTLEEGFREVLKEVKDWSRYNSSRGGSETGSQQAIHRAKHGKETFRPQMETVNSGTTVMPKTPLGRMSSQEGKAKKSPRKIQRRNTKGKGAESRPTSAADMLREGEAESPSLESVNAGEPSGRVENEENRPPTAFQAGNNDAHGENRSI